MTLTFDFEGHILKSYISRKGWSINREWKGWESIWCWTHHVTLSYDLGFSMSNVKVKFWKSCILWVGWPIDMDWRGCESKGIRTDPLCDFQLWSHLWPWLWIFKVKFLKSCISEMGRSVDMEWKGCEPIGCWTHYANLSYDLDLGHPRSNCETAVSQELNGRLTWSKRDEVLGPTVTLTFNLTHDLGLDFEG